MRTSWPPQQGGLSLLDTSGVNPHSASRTWRARTARGAPRPGSTSSRLTHGSPASRQDPRVDHRGQRPKRSHDLHGHPVGPEVHLDHATTTNRIHRARTAPSTRGPRSPSSCDTATPCDRLPKPNHGQQSHKDVEGDDHPPLEHLHAQHGQVLPERQASRHPPLRR
jgi:hypothetical protein